MQFDCQCMTVGVHPVSGPVFKRLFGFCSVAPQIGSASTTRAPTCLILIPTQQEIGWWSAPRSMATTPRRSPRAEGIGAPAPPRRMQPDRETLTNYSATSFSTVRDLCWPTLRVPTQPKNGSEPPPVPDRQSQAVLVIRVQDRMTRRHHSASCNHRRSEQRESCLHRSETRPHGHCAVMRRFARPFGQRMARLACKAEWPFNTVRRCNKLFRPILSIPSLDQGQRVQMLFALHPFQYCRRFEESALARKASYRSLAAKPGTS